MRVKNLESGCLPLRAHNTADDTVVANSEGMRTTNKGTTKDEFNWTMNDMRDKLEPRRKYISSKLRHLSRQNRKIGNAIKYFAGSDDDDNGEATYGSEDNDDDTDYDSGED